MHDQDETKTKIFISHKKDDEDAALKLSEILGDRTGGLEVYVSERILPGEEWSKWIRDKLKESDLLILLYTNPQQSWDWPLFEAGLFMQLDADVNRRVVVLYPSYCKPPRPLKNLQGVKVSPARSPKSEDWKQQVVESNRALIENFISPFYKEGTLTDKKTLNKSLTQGKMEQIAIEIAELFEPREIISEYFTSRIRLEYPEGVKISAVDIPDEVRVEADPGELSVFGIAKLSCTWGDIRRKCEEAGSYQWVGELAKNIDLVANGFLPLPVTTTIMGANDAKLYRPIPYRVDLCAQRPCRFHVLLSEQPSATKAQGSRRKDHYDRYFDLHVECPGEIKPDCIPENSRVVSNSRTLECFGLAGGPLRWKDIVRKAQDSRDDAWVASMASAVYQASQGSLPTPIFERFRARQSSTILRPELYRSDALPNGSMVFHVLLVEELESALTGIPDAIKVFATNLKLAFRFRWEVLERFCHDDLTEPDINELGGTIALIEAEAEKLGLMDQGILEAEFEGRELERIKEIFDYWAQLRREDGTGSLDLALHQKDAKHLHKILCELRPINSEFVELVARRFADLMAETPPCGA